MNKKALLLLLSFSITLLSYATHNLGGYISYKHISGLTYEFTLTMHSDVNSPAIMRKEIEINWGDNTGSDSISVNSENLIPNSNMLERVFIEQHTFPGAGLYKVSIEDPNRTAGISNISNSVNIPFALETELRIPPLASAINKSSPRVKSPLMADAFIGQKFSYNLFASEDDDDYIFYELVQTKGTGGFNASGYFFPEALSIDPINGELNWEPTSSGLFAVTVKITECRNGIQTSSTLVDLLLRSSPGPTDELLFLATWDKDTANRFAYHISPGDTMDLTISLQGIGSQPANNEGLELITTNKNASLNLISLNATMVSKNFRWITDSTHLQCAPHLFVFKGTNSDGINKDLSLLVYVEDPNKLNCDTLCILNIISLEEYPLNRYEPTIRISPNPFSTSTEIELISKSKFKNLRLKLYGRTGELINAVRESSQNKFHLHRQDLTSGIYFFSIEDHSKRIGSGKLVVSNP